MTKNSKSVFWLTCLKVYFHEKRNLLLFRNFLCPQHLLWTSFFILYVQLNEIIIYMRIIVKTFFPNCKHSVFVMEVKIRVQQITKVLENFHYCLPHQKFPGITAEKNPKHSRKVPAVLWTCFECTLDVQVIYMTSSRGTVI